ncbi:hypothetical protein B0I35DRAFT_245919 [Stachybotrys elegans]|uniref:Uncharacterized protein n=1 Tax=Stachybotrys elegans TaxID=80388 RepID=A0A8K0SV05_9HYPO|nr:hypothetical protein B0I35DRAFT_245919 [Stachybotrys elegans]
MMAQLYSSFAVPSMRRELNLLLSCLSCTSGSALFYMARIFAVTPCPRDWMGHDRIDDVPHVPCLCTLFSEARMRQNLVRLACLRSNSHLHFWLGSIRGNTGGLCAERVFARNLFLMKHQAREACSSASHVYCMWK